MSDVVELETAELLQALIRNECVNDGTADSGHERLSADLLQGYLEGAGLEVERFTSVEDRTSIVARIEGSDPTAPKMCYMGHLDVVPVNAAGWDRDPFGGDIIDGEIWGRGALDMLGLTASMAVAIKRLAMQGFVPRGDLIFFGVADEEAGGAYGAEFMVDRHWDALACDYLVTELGGFWSGDGKSIIINVAEKGLAWRRLTIKGTPGHGSMPYRTDNALTKAARIIGRITDANPKAVLDELWSSQVASSGLDPLVKSALLDPDRVELTLSQLDVGIARSMHASIHTTMSCNVVHGGQKVNIIPDVIHLNVDVRTLPGTSADDVDQLLLDICGDLATDVAIERLDESTPTASSPSGPLWDALGARIRTRFPNSELTPGLLVGGTDSRFFRDRGVVAFGAGLFSPSISRGEMMSRFHGHNERIDLESLVLTTELFGGLARDMVG